MENIEIIVIGDTEYVLIDKGNGEFVSTTKENWDAQQNNNGFKPMSKEATEIKESDAQTL